MLFLWWKDGILSLIGRSLAPIAHRATPFVKLQTSSRRAWPTAVLLYCMCGSSLDCCCVCVCVCVQSAMDRLQYVVAVLFSLLVCGRAYPFGAPMQACSTLTPAHGSFTSQTLPGGYFLYSSLLNNGGMYTAGATYNGICKFKFCLYTHVHV